MDEKVLVIDDELEIAQSTAEYFNMFDIATAYAVNYEEGMKLLSEHRFSILLLDINLGKRSGFEFCKEVRRQSNIPILFISARNSDDDILTALNIGGDDYIKKPYTLNILLAKVKAVLKRYEGPKEREPEEKQENKPALGQKIWIDERICLDCNYHQVIVEGREIKLKEMEFQLLLYLVEHADRVIGKEELFSQVWADHYVGDGTLAVHIRQLRKKIEQNPDEPERIKTVWGIGYVLEMKK